MFTEALFTKARTWKQPTCPMIGECIEKTWHIYKMKYYLIIKKSSVFEIWKVITLEQGEGDMRGLLMLRGVLDPRRVYFVKTHWSVSL